MARAQSRVSMLFRRRSPFTSPSHQIGQEHFVKARFWCPNLKSD